MKDRQPTYPGRVKLVPVSGQADTYDMTMADQPTEQGTPLSKASLLSDATAALFGLTASATPNTALQTIANFINNTALRLQSGSYVGTGIYGSANKITLTFPRSPKFVVVCADRVSYKASGSTPVEHAILLPSMSYFAPGANGSDVTWSGSTVSWYSIHDAVSQLNTSGTTYYYIGLY